MVRNVNVLTWDPWTKLQKLDFNWHLIFQQAVANNLLANGLIFGMLRIRIQLDPDPGKNHQKNKERKKNYKYSKYYCTTFSAWNVQKTQWNVPGVAVGIKTPVNFEDFSPPYFCMDYTVNFTQESPVFQLSTAKNRISLSSIEPILGQCMCQKVVFSAKMPCTVVAHC